ncbi:MAG: hypothetical protein ABR879_07265 [Methanomassiliicoccales archaeon]|jgi:uncharacterized radical SAM superfamily protein
MRSVANPEALLASAEKLASEGGTGFLLSGGCDGEGRVPLMPFVEAVATARSRWGLKANLHPGLLGRSDAATLARSGAEFYSVDLHQNEDVIHDVLHLKVPPSAYRLTMEALISAKAGAIVPHVTVGLDEDGSDAFDSIDLASSFEVDGLVVLVFTPLKGTAMASKPPPPNELVLKVLDEAKSRLRCSIALGCVRPRRNYSLEISAIKRGIRHVAMPTKGAVEWAFEHGLLVERIERCCAVHL